jgi:hypothetical protein
MKEEVRLLTRLMLLSMSWIEHLDQLVSVVAHSLVGDASHTLSSHKLCVDRIVVTRQRSDMPCFLAIDTYPELLIRGTRR